MTPKQLAAIKKHGNDLLAIFPNATERDPVALCKKLRRLEAKASRLTTDLCNGTVDQDKAEAELERIEKAMDKLLRPGEIPIFINRDPRGYALKIDDVWLRASGKTLYTDWGGYGIIAPEIDKQGR